LKLPEAFKGKYQVFHVSFFRKVLNNPFPRQVALLPPPINLTENDEKHELTAIRAVKKRYTKLWYRGNWLSWDENLKFYLVSDFKYVPGLLRDFHLANPNLLGPPAFLPDWLKAYDAGIDNYDHLNGDKTINKVSRTSFLQKKE
jgi:hypothetical protein